MNEVAQPVFLIVGATGELGAVDHTIVEMPSRNAGDIVGQALSARLTSGGKSAGRSAATTWIRR